MSQKQPLTIDALGWECPRPIIATKQLLDTMEEGEVLTIVDNKIALDNMLDYGESQGFDVTYEDKAGIYYITTHKQPGSSSALPVQEKSLVIAITSDCFGVGNEELGKSLMKSYLYALTEAETKPQTLIFVNRGVFLPLEDSEALETIQALADSGIEILACGACLNFYGMTEALAVGTISNMFQIVNKMNNAGNTIKI